MDKTMNERNNRFVFVIENTDEANGLSYGHEVTVLTRKHISALRAGKCLVFSDGLYNHFLMLERDVDKRSVELNVTEMGKPKYKAMFTEGRRSGKSLSQLMPIIMQHAAEIEEFAVVVENETGMLNDEPLTSDKLGEILHTLKHREEYAARFIGQQNVVIEKLLAALNEVYERSRKLGPSATAYDMRVVGDLARDAAKEATND
jgi:hypothetical protein